MSDKKAFRKWVAMLVLTLGLGTVWGVGVAMLGMFGSAIMKTPAPRTVENIYVANDGSPVIHTRIDGNHEHVELRTLDGKKIDQQIQQWLDSGSVDKLFQEQRWFDSQISWQERIAGMNDNQNPPTAWLAIRDAKRPGHTYFAGYNPSTKQSIGYLGREGLRSSIPARSEWFDIGNKTFRWRFRPLCTKQILNTGRHGGGYRRVNTTDENRLNYGNVYLVEGTRVQEVDLAKREVRTIANLEGLKTLSALTVPLPIAGERSDVSGSDDKQANTDSSKNDKSDTLIGTSESAVDFKRHTADRLLAQCEDRLVLINPADLSQQAFKLPKDLRASGFSVYFLGGEQWLIVIGQGHWESGPNMKLMWMDADGNIGEQKTLQLLGWRPSEPSAFGAVGLGLVAPSLLPWLCGSLGVVPIYMLNTHEMETYGGAMNKLMPECWLALVVISVLSLICAWLVARWQRKYSRKNTLLWCVTVFLFTWPALMAYWVMNRRPVMEECGECRAEVPRDRVACASCAAVFAEPRRLGTEIFA